MATDLRRPNAALDSGSFDRFYRYHRSEIYRFVLQDVGNRADAEEVTQTAFLDAFRALRRGHRPEMPRAWMYGIARNAARRRYRTLSRRPREVELDTAIEDGLAETDENPWVESVRSAFARLCPSHRQVLFLREVEGLSYAEIAERLKLSQSAVETLLFRARRSLRELCEAEGLRPAVRPSRLGSLKGLALLPAAFVGRLTDRVQHLLSPELATKTAGALTAVALGTGVAVGTHRALTVEAATAPESKAAVALPYGGGAVAVPSFSKREAPASSSRDTKSDRRGKGDRNSNRDGKPSGASGESGGSAGAGGQATPGSGSGSSGGDGGAILTTPPVSAPSVELPELPAAPPVSTPSGEAPSVEAPPVEAPSVEAPSVEVELPTDADGLLGD